MFKKNNKVKGSILFTVVSVMAILIIFLMGTLVLATSASNRAHRTYSTSQTQYTARTAIDSILEAFSSSDDFAEAICNLSSTNKSLAVDVELDQSTLASMGDIHDVVVEYVGQQKYYNENTKVWEDKDQLKITAQVTLGGITKTATGYLIKDPPKNNSSSGGGAGFVTAGDANVSNHTNTFGGTYFNINSKLAPYDFNDENVFNNKTYLYHTENETNGTNPPELIFNTRNGQAIEADFIVNGSLHLPERVTFIYPNEGTGVAIWGNLTSDNPGQICFMSKNVTSDKEYAYNKIPYLYVDEAINMQKTGSMNIGDSNLPLNIFCGRIELINSDVVNIYSDLYIMDSTDSKIACGSTSKLKAWTSKVLNKTRNDTVGSYSSGSIFSKGNLTLFNFSVNGDVKVEKDLILNPNDMKQPGSPENSWKPEALSIGGNVVVNGTLKIGSAASEDGGLGSSADTVTIGKKIYCDTVYENGKLIDSAPLKSGIEERTCYATLKTSTSILDGTTTYTWIDVYGNELGNVDVELSPVGTEKDKDNNLKKYEDAEGVQYDAPEYKAYYDTNTGVYISVDSAFESMLMTSKGVEILPLASYTDSIYPAEMEKKAILGLTTLYDINGDPLPKEETQIVQTLSEIGSGSINPYTNTSYEIPSGYQDTVDKNVYVDSNLPAEIKDSCTLQGTFKGKTIKINPGSNEIWVKIDNVKLEVLGGKSTEIVVNDNGGKVNFLISNSLYMEDGGSIITTSFKDIFDNNKDFQINTYDNLPKVPNVTAPNAPNIYIYAGDSDDINYTLTMKNKGYITGYIKAPYLNAKIPNLSDNKYNGKIYYNGLDITDLNVGANMKQSQIIGSLNVGTFNKGESGNDWTMLYIDPSSSSNPPTPNPSKTHWLLLTYYEEY